MADNNNTTRRDRGTSWLFPELLSNEGIVEFLRQRYVEVPENLVEDRTQLMELYYNHAIPLPQRKYRLNRRGREMTKKQIILAKSRKITFAEESQSDARKNVTADVCDSNPLPRFMTSASLSSSDTEKVQPPKSMINFNRKVIKLNSGKSNSDINKDLNSKAESLSLSPDNSETKPKTVKLKTSPCTDQAASVMSKKVKLDLKTGENEDSQSLKRGLSTTEEEVEKVSEDGGSPKKKIKRISWP